MDGASLLILNSCKVVPVTSHAEEPEEVLPAPKSKSEKSFYAVISQVHRFMGVLDLFENFG
jgi:hypothetical protein